MLENVNISKIRILKNCEICNDDEDVVQFLGVCVRTQQEWPKAVNQGKLLFINFKNLLNGKLFWPTLSSQAAKIKLIFLLVLFCLPVSVVIILF